jgi:hypothetical protein
MGGTILLGCLRIEAAGEGGYALHKSVARKAGRPHQAVRKNALSAFLVLTKLSAGPILEK